MSLFFQSPLHVPSNYTDVRPHHVVALYVALAGTASTLGLYTKLSHGLLYITARLTNTFLLPLVQKGTLSSMDWMSRWMIRIQLRDQLQQASPDTAESTIDAKMIVLHQLKGFHNGVSNGVDTTHGANNDEDDDDDDDEEDAAPTTTATPIDAEFPTALYSMCLGPTKKYSAGFWPDSHTTLAESEIHMLQLYCVRAGVENGMTIVDLNSGAGSLTLYLAETYPRCHITAICTKEAHRRAILKVATAKQLSNIRVLMVRCDCIKMYYISMYIYVIVR
jgi:hypothetical protein